MKYDSSSSYLRTNKFVRFYLLIAFILNFTYTCLEVYNFKLKTLFSSLGDNSLFTIKETYPVEFIRSMNISKINNIIYFLIICINLFYLITIINEKLKTKFDIHVKKCLLYYFVYLLFIFLINNIFSVTSLAPIGNLLIQLLPASIVIIISVLYYSIKTVYIKINH